MTTPPTSEGPSAEERADKVIAVWRYEFPSHRISGLAVLRMRIADALDAAKRSAHLEDARAGCVWCDPKANHEPFDSVREPQHKANWDGWWHFCKLDEGGAWRRCERPEVWDALSLLEKK